MDQFPLSTQSGNKAASSFVVVPMKMVFLVLGIVAVLMGVLWISQGAGLVNWPASSFMIDQRSWVTRGAFLTLFGLVMIAASRRRL